MSLVRDIQSVTASATAGNHLTTVTTPAFATAPVNGETIVAFVHGIHGDPSKNPVHTAPTDTAGNTYTQLGTMLIDGVHQVSMWYAANIVGGSSFALTETVTTILPDATGGNTLRMVAWALGHTKIAPYNGDVGTHVSTSGGTNDYTVTTSPAPPAASLFIGACSCRSGITISPGAGAAVAGNFGLTSGMLGRAALTTFSTQALSPLASTAKTFHWTSNGGTDLYAAIGASFLSGVEVDVALGAVTIAGADLVGVRDIPSDTLLPGAVFITGTSLETISPFIIRRDPAITIRRTLNGAPNISTFDIQGPRPRVGQIIALDVGTGVVFLGRILTVDQRYQLRTTQLVWSVTVIDPRGDLNRRRPFGTWVDVSATTIVEQLVSDFAPDFTTGGVAAALPNISIVFDGSQLFTECLDAIKAAIKGHWYLDDYDVHVFLEELTGAPDPLVDDSPTLQLDPPLVSTEDGSQLRTRVYVAGAGSTAVVDRNPGDTEVEVQAYGMFDDSGGTALAGSQRFTYTGKQITYAETPASPGGLTANIKTDLSNGGVVSGRIHVPVRYKLAYVLPTAGESPLGEPSNSTAAMDWMRSIPTVSGLDGGYALSFVTPDGETGLVTGGGNESSIVLPQTVDFDVTLASNENRITDVKVWRIKSVSPGYPGTGFKYFQQSMIALAPGLNTISFVDNMSNESLVTQPAASYEQWADPTGAGNTTGATALLTDLPVSPTGLARKLYRAEWTTWPSGTYDPERLLDTLDGTSTYSVTPYEDNEPTGGGGALVPAPLPPIPRYMLIGIPASGAGSLVNPILAGDGVRIFVERNDLDAQAALAVTEGGDGIREYSIYGDFPTVGACEARGDAELELFGYPIVTATYVTLNPTQVGSEVDINLTNPPLVASLTVQEVSVSDINFSPDLPAKYAVTASSVHFTLDDLLRKVLLAPEQKGVSSGGGGGGGTVGPTGTPGDPGPPGPVSGRHDLGGMDSLGRVTATWLPVVGARRQSYVSAELAGGITTDVVLFYRTDDAATSVQLRVRNLTDSTTTATGTLSASTSVVTETLPVVLAAGKDYELQIEGSNADNAVFGWGYLRFRP